MAFKLSDLLLVSDIDGTLLNAPNPIPKRNLEAIARFTKEGGHFAIATGRSIESLRPYAEQLPLNAPCITFNGCGIYDYCKEKLLYARFLPKTYREYTKKILDQFPYIGCVVLEQKNMYSVSDLYYTELYLGIENLPFLDGDLDSLIDRFFKTIFSMEPELVPQVEAFVNAQGWDDVAFCRSSPFFLEMLPRGAQKGSGLVELAQIMGISVFQTVAIGDYYNDLEMLQQAGIAATVAAAPDEIKQTCRLVVGECDSGAVADLIEYLENNNR